MPSTNRRSIKGALLAVAFGFLTIATPLVAASKEKLLHIFTPNGDGVIPNGGLIFDDSGNLYGTTQLGGTECNSGGTVFELSPGVNGKWTEKVLYNFPCNNSDGSVPNASLLFDAAGNLYGTTTCGGTYEQFCGEIGGTVFQLRPGKDGQWTEKVLHSFGNSNDGSAPYAGLILDSAGNLYGTTLNGGAHAAGCAAYGCGTVFRLKPGRNGEWTEKVLHSFNDDGSDGFGPYGGLTIDAAGNLYGTTAGGHSGCRESQGCGAVFELSPGPHGNWTEKILHFFNGNDGSNPIGSMIFDSAGNLYGTTAWGGNAACDDEYHVGCGTVFELTPGKNGIWTEIGVRFFYKGRAPFGGVIFDAAGNLYGTTTLGGRYWDGNLDCMEECGGTAFELSPGAGGKWVETMLHSFGDTHGLFQDGNVPTGSLVLDPAGNLYGTTQYGGDYCAGGSGCGTVFEITP